MARLPERPPRLLFDENLAARVVAALADLYPGSVHVSDVALTPAPDRTIWEHAREQGFVIVSKDEDFTGSACCTGRHQRSSGSGWAIAPPMM